MRALTNEEIHHVAGAGDDSTGNEENGSDVGGETKTTCSCADIREIYEGVVGAASRLIERIARGA